MASMRKTGDGRYTISTTKKDSLLHIETENGIVNIRLNLTDSEGRKVAHISTIPDDFCDEPPVTMVGFDGGCRLIRELKRIGE